MKYLLIGGAGFIGRAIAKQLAQCGHDITIIDDLSTSPPITQSTFDPAVELIYQKAQEFAMLDSYIQAADVVYFLAGSVGVAHVVTNPYDTLINNVELASTVVSSCKRHNKYIIFASTSEVYGDGPYSESDDARIPHADNLRWGYASGKLTTEFMVAGSGCRFKILRLFNITGPGQIGEHGMVLPRFVKAALAGDALIVHGTGAQVRSFMHVQDAVDMILSLERTQPSGIFNIGTSSSSNITSISHLANLVIYAAHSTSNIITVPHSQSYGIESGDITHRVPDMTKTLNVIGYRKTTNLLRTINDMVIYDQFTH